MNLVVDIGNTLTKAYIFDGDIIVNTCKSDDYASINNFIQQNQPVISQSIISSVASSDPDIIEYLNNQAINYIYLDTNTPVPINNIYKTPSTLGKDRLAAAVGACNIFKGYNVLIIDIGTAIKYDFVDKNANFCGGAIAPGMQLRFKALNQFTGRLPLIECDGDYKAITGADTRSSILSGVQNGMLFEINGFIKQYLLNYPNLKIVFTGGDSFFFENKLKYSIFAEPNLVAIGLNQILKYNYAKFL